ncbi:MAG TPA: response regulator [Acidimicrobiia bacterium]|nr:response regulator [Acidimicrobiia bacterium]
MPRILVADDTDTIRKLLTSTLERVGYEVKTVRDGPTAYAIAKEGDFDLIILDQLMPGLLGLDVIDQLRNDGVEVPVIMLSGVDDGLTAAESLHRGAVDYIRKPFEVTELLARIEARL